MEGAASPSSRDELEQYSDEAFDVEELPENGEDEDMDLEETTETEDQDSSESEGQLENLIEVRQGPGGEPQIQVSGRLLSLLDSGGLRQLLARNGRGDILSRADLEREDEDDDDYDPNQPRRRRRLRTAQSAKFPPVPSEAGQKLMLNGKFGQTPGSSVLKRQQQSKLATKLMYRELGKDRYHGYFSLAGVSQDMIPSSPADKIIHYKAPCYSGQFSDDGNFFFCCVKDFRVRLYDTSNPYDWRYYKNLVYPYGSWTLTDATLSPDNKYLAFSSIRSIVCLSSTDQASDAEPWLLDFSDFGGRRSVRRGWNEYNRFAIWSIRFSGDGREIVAGTGGPSVCVYDIERRQTIIDIDDGHREDVNAVCFGDKSSPHILYSGSDDTLIKVWDRRSLGDGRAAGVFVGHTEGLTYVDSKGDGRYVLSNGKDQTMKLWDLRSMMSTEKAAGIDTTEFSTGYDYRWGSYPDREFHPHPQDCSIVTYRGHKVLKTLIRCHFSPATSTNSRYVYSGSDDGSVYIYNMDATLAGKVDVNKATYNSRDKGDRGDMLMMDDDDRQSWTTCVRDASWHPYAPIIAATAWNGWGRSTGTCTMHGWNDGAEEDEGYPSMGLSVDQKLLPEQRQQRRRQGLRSQRLAARTMDDEEDDSVW